ncbi:ABC transporter ATP-binding protein, partial [Flavobacteriaceae bacterium]|nr:ABC transporter ATP-binding protein [Flavobacteriaceae bacterium]
DLDIITLNVLESFLLDFPGCLIVVSHDRYFMDKIIDHLFVFKGSGNIENFPGNYSDYRAYEDSKIKNNDKELKSESYQLNEKKKHSNKNNLNYLQQKEFKKLEKEIKKIEFLKEEIQNHFNHELSLDDVKKYSIKLKNIEEDLELKTNRWFELSEN